MKSTSLNKPYVTEGNEWISEHAIRDIGMKIFLPNTILIAMLGDGKTRGMVSELCIPAAINQACAALTFSGSSKQLGPFVKLFFQKYYDDIRQLSSGGVQLNLNLGIIRKTQIALPSLAELRILTEELTHNLSIADKIEEIASQSLLQSKTLHKSILKKAFDGKLVPQDPNDEPAELLLEKIRQGKSNVKNKNDLNMNRKKYDSRQMKLV